MLEGRTRKCALIVGAGDLPEDRSLKMIYGVGTNSYVFFYFNF